MSSGSDKHVKRRVKFERHASRVVFDPSSSSFVVTWKKCNVPKEMRISESKDPTRWMPSVAAIATLYDRGCVPSNQVYHAAKAVGRAWSNGDRQMLDTENARKAAELVHDLSTMCVDSSSPSVAKDIGQAMRHLLDEIASVRFMNSTFDSVDVNEIIDLFGRSIDECLADDSFVSWPPNAMRRKFIYCMRRRDRTDFVYTIVSLLFDSGCCPLLSISDRRSLRMKALQASGLDSGYSRENTLSFVRYVIDSLFEMKRSGRTTLGSRMTQQQLADSLSGSSCS